MPEVPAKIVFSRLRVGDTAGFDLKVTQKMTDEFARLSGNFSPLHTDPEFAAATEFKKPIAYGMQAGAYISRLLGMHLPGAYGVCLSQQMSFHKPIYPGMSISVRGKVIQKAEDLRVARIETLVADAASGELLVSGWALVRFLR